MSYYIEPCNNCAYEGERYYSGTTCRYCGQKDKFIFDIPKQERESCKEFIEYEEPKEYEER